MRFGLVLAGVGILLTAGLTALGVSPWLRAIAFLPFFGAGTGVFQALDGT
jgi:hypothetical protein